MWHIYISIAVLFSGAFCYPAKQIAEDSNCTVVITRFGEQVTTLEVKWDSNIHLICNASCVGPGPQPGLTWFYKDKNQKEPIRIERLFQSQKFQTYPTNSHRINELVIRHFGPNEETDFICKGSTKRDRVEAKVTLTGTDCLLKYNFKCKFGDKCIDRAYLCNKNNECPHGEDEVGCDYNMTVTTTVATTRMPEMSVGTEKTWDDNYSMTVTTTVATTRMPEMSVGTEKTWDDNDYNDMSTIMMPQTDVKTKQTSEEIVTAAPPAACTADQYKCANGECVDGRFRCDGKLDCNDESDEENCQIHLICPEGKKGCKDFSKCIDDYQLCNRVPDCTDGSDEKDCDLKKMKTKMLTVGTNDDGDNGILSTTDGVTDNTSEFTDTTPFEYDLYA